MSVARTHHTKDYTCMSNHHFKDKNLSLKAKGLLSLMLSLSETWDYNVKGLATLSSDGETSVRTAVKELEDNHYVKRTPIRSNGKIVDWEYDIYEIPLVENQQVENQQVENLILENKDNKVHNKNKTLIEINNKVNKNKRYSTNSSDVDWFVSQYNKICCSLPKVKSATDKRKKAILNILKKYSEDDILDVFELVESSNFCKGNNDRGWKADIDFILREDKFVNILEGKYNNSNSKSNTNKRFINEGHTERYTEAEKEEMQEVLEELRKNGEKTVY